jgi:hypothetical protein
MEPKKAPVVPRLNVVGGINDPMIVDLEKRHVQLVHGTNSCVFEGLVRYRALLSMAEIDATPWFHRNRAGLQSGERGNTLRDLSQPISRGVSFNQPTHYHDSIGVYANYGQASSSSAAAAGAASQAPTCSNGKKQYRVLIGLDHQANSEIGRKGFQLEKKIPDHPLSIGGVSIDHIIVIYVPEEHVADAQNRLSPPIASEKIVAFPRRPG